MAQDQDCCVYTAKNNMPMMTPKVTNQDCDAVLNMGANMTSFEDLSTITSINTLLYYCSVHCFSVSLHNQFTKPYMISSWPPC